MTSTDKTTSIDRLKEYVRLRTKEMFCETCSGEQPLVDILTCDGRRIIDLIEQVESEANEFGSTVGEAVLFSRRVEEAVKNGYDVTLFGVDYMPYPVDNQGRVIRLGDIVHIKGITGPHEVEGVGRKFGNRPVVWLDNGTWELVSCIESYATTPSPVEEMLGEMYDRLDEPKGDDLHKSADEIIGEYAARLKLKETE